MSRDLGQGISTAEIERRLASGEKLTTNQRRYLDCLERGDEDKCAYCKRPLTDATRTIDHIIPKSQGGTNKLKNICLACKACNGKKGNRTPEQWKAGITQAQIAQKAAVVKIPKEVKDIGYRQHEKQKRERKLERDAWHDGTAIRVGLDIRKNIGRMNRKGYPDP